MLTIERKISLLGYIKYAVLDGEYEIVSFDKYFDAVDFILFMGEVA